MEPSVDGAGVDGEDGVRSARRMCGGLSRRRDAQSSPHGECWEGLSTPTGSARAHRTPPCATVPRCL
eukprot:3541128-Prymnesium_polylepis.1